MLVLSREDEAVGDFNKALVRFAKEMGFSSRQLDAFKRVLDCRVKLEMIREAEQRAN